MTEVFKNMFFFKALAIWMIMVIAAVGNGILRESILNEYFGASYALPISGLLLSILIFAIIYFSINLFAAKKSSYYLALGLFWGGLTLTFEYGFGYFVRGMEFSEINQIFNVSTGNLFSLVIAVILLGPSIIARFKRVV